MFVIISEILKYVFIFIIYLFIFNILKLIYLDIKSLDRKDSQIDSAYFKVVNRLDTLDFKMDDNYILKGDVTVGRSSKNTIVIKDKFVSSRHMKIHEEDGSYFIEDLDSQNGTYLNGQLIEDIIELKNGDTIGVGFIQFIFVEKGQ